MTVKHAITLFITLFAVVCLSVSADVAPTGKIIGQVINAETGEPIADASVMVVGTRRGAVTDFDGRYMISQIEPGTYTIKITHLDFAAVTLTGVEVSLSEASDSAVSNGNTGDTVYTVPISAEEREQRAANLPDIKPRSDVWWNPNIDKEAIQTQTISIPEDSMKLADALKEQESPEGAFITKRGFRVVPITTIGELTDVWVADTLEDGTVAIGSGHRVGDSCQADQSDSITTVGDLLRQDAGDITNQHGEIFIRGGRNNEVVYKGLISDPLGGLRGSEPEGMTNYGGIAGVITDATTGMPIKGASVIVVGTTHSTVTNSEGEFVFKRAGVGEYEFVISGQGYRAIKVSGVRIHADVVTDLSHQLEKSR